MQELVRVRYNRDESISDFMNRVRLLLLAAHQSETHKESEKFLISHLIGSLYDNRLALQISIMRLVTAAEEKRMATA